MNTKIPGLGIAHLALKAKDFDKSYKFYTEGTWHDPLSLMGRGDSHIQMLKFGDGAGILRAVRRWKRRAPRDGKYIHFAYSVEDVDAAYETALAAGAKPLTPPKSVALESEPRKVTIRIAFVIGPDGEQIEFFKEVG